MAIETVKIRIGKKEIELTVTDAKALKKVLEDLFGKEIVKEQHDHHHYHDNWYWPYYWPKKYYHQDIVWGGTSAATGGSVPCTTSQVNLKRLDYSGIDFTSYNGKIEGTAYNAKFDSKDKVLAINITGLK